MQFASDFIFFFLSWFLFVCLLLSRFFDCLLPDRRIVCQLVNFCSAAFFKCLSVFRNLRYMNEQCALLIIWKRVCLSIAYDIWLDIRLSSAKARTERGISNCIAKVTTCRGDRYRSNEKYYSKIPHCFHTKSSVVLCVVEQIIGHGQVTWRKLKPLLSCVTSIFEIFEWALEWVKP